MKLWQVMVKYLGAKRAVRSGGPVTQDKAVREVEKLNDDPKVIEAWCKEVDG